ncbi:MAG: IS1634 family transposase [Candidatus Abawacabacteria bacterium]|nr:IS1634 family transposase [Candidatus Abawacabacteria bacterium]
MYITEVPTKTKTGKISHLCILLRESYWEDKKVKNRTIANLTHCNPKEVAALRLALEHKDDLTVLKSLKDNVEIKQGMSIGAVWVVYEIARQLGIEKALGTECEGKLALWQVIARVISQGSRLSAVRLAQVHAGCDILGIRQRFNEDHLYKNLAWLAKNQKQIEKKLFKVRSKGKKPELFLYDVTSSYFEGIHNELADWGYNRDKKLGKKQVVLGLLCDEGGWPVSIEVFAGNTSDLATFGSQIKKAAEEFGCERVTFVGDRGMIKSGQIAELKGADFHYITAITKAQIEKLLKREVIQLGLFDTKICEVEDDGVRYILRRNPLRVEEIAKNRKEKKESIEKLCQKKNKYLTEHPRAKVETAINKINKQIKHLKISGWLKVEVDEGKLTLKEDEEVLAKEGKLDGCYVIKSDLSKEIDKQAIHDRYKDLADVEQAFRTCKTAMLEMRPWYVWTQESTRGHAVVIMLAYLIVRTLQQAWADFDLTVEEGLKQLSMLCSMEMVIKGESSCHRIPTPCSTLANLLKAAKVHLPTVLPHLGTTIVSRKKIAHPTKLIDFTDG